MFSNPEFARDLKGGATKNSLSLVSSRTIASQYHKRHDHVLRDIRNLIKRNPEYRLHFNINLYTNWQNNQQYEEFLLDKIAEKAIRSKYELGMQARKLEISIYEEIKKYCDVMKINLEYQKCVLKGKYRIDFYLVEPNIAIEFDEKYHSSKSQRKSDFERQNEIINAMGCSFVRFQESESIGNMFAKLTKEIIHNTMLQSA